MIEEFKTLAQQIIGGKEIMTKRPEGMDFQIYKQLIKSQNKTLKKILHGR